MKKIVSFLMSLLLIVLVANLFAPVIGVTPFIVAIVLFALGSIPTPKGVLMFNWANVDWGDGLENMGGLQVIGYYALIEDIDNFPQLPANPANAADEITLESVTGFTFKTGKNFFKLYSTMETSEVVDEPQGEWDGQSFAHKANMFHPGTRDEALAFAKGVSNSNMVFVFIEASGARRVVGSRAFPAKCKPSVTTGKATADRKGVSLEILSYGYTPAPKYTGDISLTPAV